MKLQRLVLNVACALAVVTVAANFSRAEDKSSGCGLGWQVSKRDSLVSSSFRSTTNAVGSQTFAMTSGTSGCAKHSIVKNEKQGLHYAEANYENLVVEMAEGHGEYLEAFSAVLGCSPSMYPDFSQMTRNHYSEIMTSETANGGKLLENVKSVMKTDPRLAGCTPAV